MVAKTNNSLHPNLVIGEKKTFKKTETRYFFLFKNKKEDSYHKSRTEEALVSWKLKYSRYKSLQLYREVSRIEHYI